MKRVAELLPPKAELEIKLLGCVLLGALVLGATEVGGRRT